MAVNYIIAPSTGAGFITHDDQEVSGLSFVGAPADVWAITGTQSAIRTWASRVAGTSKTKTQAQRIIDNALVGIVDEKNKPVVYTL